MHFFLYYGFIFAVFIIFFILWVFHFNSPSLDNFNHATAIHATHAISIKLINGRIAQIARVQVACPIKMVNSASI